MGLPGCWISSSVLSQALNGSLGELKQGQTEPPKGSFDARQSKLAASLVELTGSVILAAPPPAPRAHPSPLQTVLFPPVQAC